jgi:FkbH-like protein
MHFPFDPDELLMEKRRLRRVLLDRQPRITRRVAILGGSTTAEVRDLLELFLLADGIASVLYESDYNQFFEEAVFHRERLVAFAPDLIYIHTSVRNVREFPKPGDDEAVAKSKLDSEFARFRQVWDALRASIACPIVQNNFELPLLRHFGNLDSSHWAGCTHFVSQLNMRLAQFARDTPDFHISDIQHLSARLGLNVWFDDSAWFSYRYAMSVPVIPYLAHNVASLAKAIFGFSKKCLVLDLDNTLWGGVIGDDGIDNIQIGQGNPLAEAHLALQAYVKNLAERGIVLAVCSKNDAAVATSGLQRPGGLLQRADFAGFRANWNDKHINIAELAEELRLGMDSIVFLDDNPAERDIVRTHLESVLVPEVGTDVATYARTLDQSGAFETARVSQDDLQRTQYYRDNSTRAALPALFSDYGNYLRSLHMKAEIGPFRAPNLERVIQLINKTNQFNLTALRMSAGDVRCAAADASRVTLYGRLRDKFGDNGLVTVVIGSRQGIELHIDIWLMSCRVLKRDLEKAMFDALCDHARGAFLRSIVGYFKQTARNQMVADHYKDLGFTLLDADTPRGSKWVYDVEAAPQKLNHVIDVTYVN